MKLTKYCDHWAVKDPRVPVVEYSYLKIQNASDIELKIDYKLIELSLCYYAIFKSPKFKYSCNGRLYITTVNLQWKEYIMIWMVERLTVVTVYV